MIRLVVAVLAGLLAGTVFALGTRGEERAPRPAAAPTQSLPPGVESGPVIRDARLRFTVPDPAGGPRWAIRGFTQPAGKDESVECVQLGRVVDGEFGWLDPRFGFREVRTYVGAPSACDFKPRGGLSRFALPDDEGRPVVTVTWGLVSRRVERVVLERGVSLAPRHRVVLDIRPGLFGGARLQGNYVLADGNRKPLFESRIGGRIRELLFSVHGEAKVAVRVADPSGGVPWGILVAEDGCLSSPARVVGDWLGQVDSITGVVSADPFDMAGKSCRDPEARPTREAPVSLDAALSSGFEEDAIGTKQLRRLPGRIALHGAVLPGVESVTLITPRDTRTLLPSARGRAILAVYDGSFPGKDVTTIAHFRNGRTVEQTFEAGA